MTDILLILAVLAAMTLAVAILVAMAHRRRARHLSAHDRSVVHVRWQEVENQLNQGSPTHYRQAVIQADNLLDYCLKRLGVPGKTMGERLRAAESRFSHYDDVWKAHKVRNQIVHEHERELLAAEARQVLGKFRQALQDVGGL